MRRGADLPVVPPGAPMREVIAEITRGRMGITCVVDGDGRLAGVVTDGDVRRAGRHRRRPVAVGGRGHEPHAGHRPARHLAAAGAPPAGAAQDHPRWWSSTAARPIGVVAPARPLEAPELGLRSPCSTAFAGSPVPSSRRCSPCSPAWPSARRGSATSCATAGGSIAARPATRTHYVLGLNFLVANQIDLAIEELSQAARVDADALEIHLILGNVYRERGQVTRAIQVHQALLQRQKLTRLEHAYVMLCLGLDFKRGGFVDRAVEAFKEVRRLDPHEHLRPAPPREGLRGAAPVGRGGAHPPGTGGARRAGAAGPQPGHPRLPRERARAERAQGRRLRHGRGALSRRARSGRLRHARPRSTSATRWSARATSTRRSAPGKAWSSPRPSAPTSCSSACAGSTSSAGSRPLPRLCRRLVAARPQNWRARLALGGELAKRRIVRAGARSTLEALGHNPHGLAVHEAIWETLLQLGLEPRPGRALRAARQGRGLLPRPARLPALPLPQHRAAVAVPALPRVEQLRRGADRAGEGARGV